MSENRGMTIVISGTKGGPGKSTMVQNVACEYARLGSKVCIYDCDDQGSINKWLDRREAHKDFAELPVIKVKAMSNSLRDAIADDVEKYDVVIVDVAGRISRELTTALFSADIVLIPTAPTIKDTEQLGNIAVELEDTAIKAPEHRRAYGMVNKVIGHSQNDALEARAYFAHKAFNGAFEPLRQMVSMLKPFDTADALGLGVVEVKKANASKAKAQIQLLVQEINTRFSEAITETYSTAEEGA